MGDDEARGKRGRGPKASNVEGQSKSRQENKDVRFGQRSQEFRRTASFWEGGP